MKTSNSYKPKPSLRSTNTPHDLFFKDIFSQKRFAIELLKLVFSPEEQKLFNFSTLKGEKTLFKSHKADLIFSLEFTASTASSGLKHSRVPYKKTSTVKRKSGLDHSIEASRLLRHKKETSSSILQKAFIFLILEHKSQKDGAVLVQLLRYQALLYSHYLEHTGCIVPIIPIIFYHGKEVWGQKLTFFQNMFKKNVFPTKFKAFFKENVLNFHAKVLDIQSFDAGRFQKLKNLKSGLAFYLLRKIWSFKWPEDGREMMKWVEGLSEKDQDRLLLFGSEYIKDVCGVSQENLEALELEALQTGILRKGGNMGLLEYVKQKKMREIKQAAIQEGLKEGRQRGLQEGIEQGIEQGVQQGIEQGVQRGMKQGVQQGMKQGVQQIVLSMLQNKADMSFICKVTGLSEQEVQKLKTRV